MKRTILFLLLAFQLSASAQETNIVLYTAQKIDSFYNKQLYAGIFMMFAPQMKEVLPFDKTVNFFAAIYDSYGKIEKMDFDRYDGKAAVYKTQLERKLMAFKFALDGSNRISGMLVEPYVPNDLSVMARNTTKLSLPFNGEWTVFWGGDLKEQNHHVGNLAQKNAFDIIITDKTDKSYKTDGKTNEDYYCYGQPLIAPCDATVVAVVDGIKDNKPGDMNEYFVPGNCVILKTKNNEYLFFAHLKNHSAKVKENMPVKKGQPLGACGNSGNSSEPHLHFHIQNTENINVATGVKCYFENITVNGTGQTDYSPLKNERIKNAK